MPWTYSATAFYGNKTAPAKGNYVTVQIANPDSPEQYRYLTYTFDGTRSRASFLAMVKAEVKATIHDWNTQLPVSDASGDFQPTALAIAAEPSPLLAGETQGRQPATPARSAKASRASSREKA